MPLSSNTLVHLAREKENLFGILRENFRVYYCLETIQLAGETYRARIPMVSFCDIPLSQIKEHIEKYGSYGIGLTKEWAQRSGLNPVLYMEPDSLLAKSYRTAFHHFVVEDDSETLTDGQRCLADVLRYIKNYQGELIRQGTQTPNYRYSDEREWRYVPPADWKCQMIADADEYERDKANTDAGVADLRLEFTPNDIKYIIIQSDAEIAEFVHLLRSVKGTKYSYNDVERLTTRILTSEQIFTDV